MGSVLRGPGGPGSPYSPYSGRRSRGRGGSPTPGPGGTRVRQHRGHDRGEPTPHALLARPSPPGQGHRGGVAQRARADLDAVPRASSLAGRRHAPASRGRAGQGGVREGAGGGGRQQRRHDQGQATVSPLVHPSPLRLGPWVAWSIGRGPTWTLPRASSHAGWQDALGPGSRGGPLLRG